MPNIGDKVVAKFQPKDMTQIVGPASQCVGKQCEWVYLFQIGPKTIQFEDGSHVGEWAVQPMDRSFPFRWTLEEDLEIVPSN
jgi:hypothetical protein